MVVTYTIFGQKVGSHILAIATLGSLFVGSYIGLSGGKKPEDKAKGPPINAGSKDEENFITEFITKADADKQR